MRHSAAPLDLEAAVFDFDGTLINSGPGILKTVRATAAELGLPSPSEELLRRFIGPPLIYSFTRAFDMTKAEAEEASRIYRRILAETDAYKDAYFYPGILDLVKELPARGITPVIASAKRKPIIEKTLDYFGCRELFPLIFGAPAGNETADKPRITMAALEASGASARAALMIGDSDYDGLAADFCGLPLCAVLWGWGFTSPEQARRCHAAYIVETVADLAGLLLPPQ